MRRLDERMHWKSVLEKRITELEAGNKPPEQAEPKLEDYDYDDAVFNIALTKFHSQKAASEAVNSYQTEQKQAADKVKQDAVNEGFNTRVAEFSTTNADYAQVVETLPDLPSDVLDAIMTNEKGPELAYYLGKHLDVAENIDLMKLGTISAQLATIKPTKAPSAAPEPIEPVKPGGTLNKSQDEMSMDEIYAQD